MSNFNFSKKNVKLLKSNPKNTNNTTHMLLNPKPKNTMTRYIHSSMLKTIQFYYILIISFTNVYNYVISVFFSIKYFFYKIYKLYLRYTIWEDLQNPQNTFRVIFVKIHSGYLFGHKRLFVFSLVFWVLH